MRRLALALAILGCGSKADEPGVEVTGAASASDIVKGELSLDGQPVALGACKPGHSVRPFVELVTARGKLRFEDQQLYWNPTAGSPARGDRLDCDKLDRSWGGGVRMPGDGTSYWRGKLWFRCQANPASGTRAIAGELELDCGNITPTERAQLDGKRQELQDEQARGSAPAPAKP